AEAAQTDDPSQPLDVSGLVVLPALMRLQPLADVRVATGAARLAPVVRASIDHATQPVPITLTDTTADIGKPARVRDQIHEQPVAERAVLTVEHIGQRSSPDPRLQFSHPRPGRIPGAQDPIPPCACRFG